MGLPGSQDKSVGDYDLRALSQVKIIGRRHRFVTNSGRRGGPFDSLAYTRILMQFIYRDPTDMGLDAPLVYPAKICLA